MVNAQHRERVAQRVNRLCGPMQDLTDDDVAELLWAWEEEAAVFQEAKGRASTELLRRMTDRAEGETVTDRFHLKCKEADIGYSWDIAKVLQARVLLAPAEWDSYIEEIPPKQESQYRINTTRLLAAAKRKGGEFKQIIDDAYTRTPKGAPRVTVERIG